jgi:hypothetical protein
LLGDMTMRFSVWVAVIFCAFSVAGAAEAAVSVSVDMTTQRMHVQADSGASYDWPVSTAGRGYRTPRGSFHSQSMEVMHRSRKYHNSPMPHSIFFSGGYAIHGTYSERNLGRAASHGCVRLSRGNAATLFALVRKEGGASITLTGTPPAATMLAVDGHSGATHAGSRHEGSRLARRDAAGAALGYAPVPRQPSLLEWLVNPAGH